MIICMIFFRALLKIANFFLIRTKIKKIFLKILIALFILPGFLAINNKAEWGLFDCPPAAMYIEKFVILQDRR